MKSYIDLLCDELNTDFKLNGSKYSKDKISGMQLALTHAKRAWEKYEALLKENGEVQTKNPEKNRYILIDGSSVLVSAFYANAPKEVYMEKDEEVLKHIYETQLVRNANGEYINGYIGMMKRILGLLKYQKPNRMFIAFDQNRQDIFRTKLYPEYKAQRKPSPEPLKEQMAGAEEMLLDMGIMAFSTKGYEADDLIGSLAKRIEKEDPEAEIYVLTKDRDYLQLISKKTTLWLMQQSWDKADEIMNELYGENKPENTPPGCVALTPDTCEKMYHLKPEQIADWKGITGDSSDNIPGIYRVGDSAAIPLLKEYGHIENIYAEIDKYAENNDLDTLKKHWKDDLGIKMSPLKNLIEYKEMGILSKKLATIVTSLKIQSELDEFSIDADEQSLIEILDEKGITPYLVDDKEEDMEEDKEI